MDRKKARNWYWWLWLSPLLTIPTLVFIALATYFLLDFNELPAAMLAAFVSAAWHLFLLIPLNNKESSFVRWHGKQMLILAAFQMITIFSLLLLLVYEEVIQILIAGTAGLIWFFGTLFGQLQAAKGDCSLMRWYGHQDELPDPAPERGLIADRRRARNWYWWLWLSPLLTIPTTVFLVLVFTFPWNLDEWPTMILAIFGSALWHLLLRIPLNDKQSSFVRWHGKQMLILAGLQIITLFSLLLSLVYDESLIIIAGVIGLTWFFGTLLGQFQAARGDCSLMRWLGHEDELIALATETQVDEAAGLDPDAMVEIIRFSRDSEERRKALKELERLGMVEVLGDSSGSIPSQTPTPIAAEKIPDEKKSETTRWIVLGFFAIIIIGMMLGSIETRSQKKENARISINQGKGLAANGNIGIALEKFAEAQALDPELQISAEEWNAICWFGSLWERATYVMDACEKAVTLDPASGAIRDSRGVARALLGDYEGAIEDFEFFLEQYKKEGICDEDCLRREKWIDALAAGINPFDAQLLEDLKN